MIVRRYLLIESDHERSTLSVIGRFVFRRRAEYAMIRQMDKRGRQMIEPERRYVWSICPAVRIPRDRHV